MNQTIDIDGASGATYRFRLHSQGGTLPATAGNFAYARPEGSGFVLVCCGETRSLVNAYRHWEEARLIDEGIALYLRLNVTKTRRQEECADIVALHRPPLIARGVDG